MINNKTNGLTYGLIFGVSLGIIFKNLAIGIGLGLAIGGCLDLTNNKKNKRKQFCQVAYHQAAFYYRK